MKRAWPEHACPGNDNAVAEDDLQAYVDGQLDGGRRAAIESYLAANPGEAARVAAYRAQNIGLHALFDPRPGTPGKDEGVPPRIAALAGALDARLADRHEAKPPHRLRNLAASVVVLLTAGTAGAVALQQVWPTGDSLVAFTRQATEMPLQPAATKVSNATAAGTERQVIAWLAAQPGDVPATVPDLAALGFRLTGEDLLPAAGGAPAAQLRYQDDSGRRLTLTMRAGGKAGQTSFTFARDGQESRFVWQDAHMAYSLVGSLAQDKLLEIAESISQDLREEAPAVASQETAEAPAAGEGDSDGSAAAPTTPLDPTAPDPKAKPIIDQNPLIPVPLPVPDAPKET
jgi:anti-sigma factor RsiW